MTHLLLANISAHITHERNWCDSFINELIKWSSDDAIMWGITYGEWWTYFCVFVLQFIIYYLVVGATNIPIKWKKILYWYKIIATVLIIVLYILLVTFIKAVDNFKATV